MRLTPSSVGDVQVVNVSSFQTNGHDDDTVVAGNCFAGSQTVAATSAQYSQVQVWNPAASGKYLYVDHAWATMTAAGSIYVGPSTQQFAFTPTPGVNKDLGGAASVASVDVTVNAAILAATTMYFVDVPANNTLQLTFDPPIRIPAGAGLSMANSATNAAMGGGFSWREKIT